MENVLIDDRRIHVDFSQSVTKFKPQNRAAGRMNKKEQVQAQKNITKSGQENYRKS